MNFMNNQKVVLIALGIVGTLLFEIPLPASAQNPKNCVKPASNFEIRNCMYLGYKSSDRELNLVWNQVISQLRGDEKEQLIDEQLAWIEERDAICHQQTELNRGGNFYFVFLNSCLMKKTIERTKSLREYLR
jgi:uncharacterized protein YecT (DUF1311 family)